MILALIPARGQSRGISRKNARHLAGFPLVAWSILAAQKAKVDQVVVSTDDDEIGDLAHTHSAEVVWRPAELATDDCPDLPVVEHALRAFDVPDDAIVVYLRPTSPFRRPEEINEVVELMRRRPEVSSVRSVVPATSHPQKMYAEAGPIGLPYRVLMPYLPAFHAANAPRQGLGAVYKPVGFIDAVRARWMWMGSMEGPVIARWDAPVERAVDLDDESQWSAADGLAVLNGWAPGRCG